MILSLSEKTLAKVAAIFAALLIGLLAWAYISGAILLAAMGGSPDQVKLLTIYQYWYHYGTNPAVSKWLMISSAIGFAVVLVPVYWLVAPAKRSLFGDARFATNREIKKAGLLGEDGIIVGRMGGKYLTFPGTQHAIISAPTRSGKGVGIVIPNLLNWPDSVVVLDIKRENWDITSAFRKKHGQKCFLFNPAAADYRSHRYNPLSYISTDPNFRIDDVQKIGNMLFPDVKGTDVIWTGAPRELGRRRRIEVFRNADQ